MPFKLNNAMNKLETQLTSSEIQYVKNQTFIDNEPGTLLKDFSSLLDFIGTTGIAVSKKNHLFSIKLLPSLNQLMSTPLESKLKRPQQKSFPHINGLYLLLRASGLSYIVTEKKDVKLIISDVALEKWHSLNPSERYFALFYAWWHRGSDEIIGERDRGFCKNYFYESASFFQQTLKKGCDLSQSRNIFESLRYRPGFHNLALMELFGFVSIALDSAMSKENWPIVKIKPTKWGEALLKCFAKETASFNSFEFEISDDEQIESWGAEVKAYIPTWINNLEPEDTDDVIEGEIIFKASLGKVYRKLAIPSTIDLDELASSILTAFNFNNDHLYEFVYKNDCGITERIAHSYADSGNEWGTSDYLVGQLPLYKGMELIFHFDFGDDWEFLLVVESFMEADSDSLKPKVIEQQGTPPEQYPDWDD